MTLLREFSPLFPVLRHSFFFCSASPAPARRRTGGILWFRAQQRLLTQMRVISAFRNAGAMSRLAERNRRLALSAPESGAFAPRHLWQSAVHRIRFQLRVVLAFRNAVVRGLAAIESDPVNVATAAAGNSAPLHLADVVIAMHSATHQQVGVPCWVRCAARD